MASISARQKEVGQLLLQTTAQLRSFTVRNFLAALQELVHEEVKMNIAGNRT
jgi:hypothetical protein